MESLQKLKTEETKIELYKTAVSTISPIDCVSGVALACNPCRRDYMILIGKQIARMFYLHGKEYNQQLITTFLESLYETYKYETPETILLFLQRAANGDYGKFYGAPDIGTLREWMCDFLQQTIIPERERFNTTKKEIYDTQREQKKSLREIIEGSPRLRA